MVDRLSKDVSCTFCDAQGGLTQVDVSIPTGLNSDWIKLRHACCDFARDNACEMWAMPALGLSTEWLVYKVLGRAPEYLKSLPTRAAAEMWMLHRG